MLAELILGGSALYLGIQGYNQKEKRKRLADGLCAQIDQESKFIGLPVGISKVQPASYASTRKLLDLFSIDSRSKQLKEFSSNDEGIRSLNQTRLAYKNKLLISGIAFVLATVGLVYSTFGLLSLPFIIYRSIWTIKDAIQRLRQDRKPTVDMLIIATILSGILFGTSAIFSGSALLLVLVSMDIFLISWNDLLISNVRHTTKVNLVDVFKQQPKSAWLYKNGIEVEAEIDALASDDVIVAHAGEIIPVDGQILKGVASIDQRMLTGEAQPAEKGEGETVFALTTVISGKIYISVEKTGEETTSAQIGKILNQTINFKTGMQLWTEDISNKSVLPTLATYGVLLPIMGPQSALAILVGHPKLKTMITTYLGVLSYFNLASQDGILIKDGIILELLNQVDTVVFDKTGTLTEEQPHIGQIFISKNYIEDDILTYAAAAEYRQTHPIALAILRHAESRGLKIPDIDEIAYKIGYGLTVTIGTEKVRVGSTRFIQDEQLLIPSEIMEAEQICHEQGHSLIIVAVNDEVAGAITLQPTIRPEARSIIQELRKCGIDSMYIISGDHETPTRTLANELGIDHYFAETLPENKADLIEQLQNEGKMVCYVGDGINDAIALKKAAVSVSLRGASTVATDTAQVILMDGNLTKLNKLFELAHKFDKNTKQTFTFVLIPHIVTLVGVLFFNFGLAPAIILTHIGLAAGVGNAIRPQLQKDI